MSAPEDSSSSSEDVFSSQPDWVKQMVVDYLTAEEALKLSATCRSLRVVKLVDKPCVSSRAKYWGGLSHQLSRWQFLRSDHCPSRVHSTMVMAQAWEEGQFFRDSRDGRIMIVETDKTAECGAIGCCELDTKVPKGRILPSKSSKKVPKRKPLSPQVLCVFRPNLQEKEYSVWVGYGGGFDIANVVRIRRFKAKDLIYTTFTSATEKAAEGDDFFEWQQNRIREWENWENDWHSENPGDCRGKLEPQYVW